MLDNVFTSTNTNANTNEDNNIDKNDYENIDKNDYKNDYKNIDKNDHKNIDKRHHRRPRISDKLRHLIKSQQRHKCFQCAIYIDDLYDIDHDVPYCIVKRHDRSNLRALCVMCHTRKSRKEQGRIVDFFRFLANKSRSSERRCWKCKDIVSAYFFNEYQCSRCEDEKRIDDDIKNGRMPDGWCSPLTSDNE